MDYGRPEMADALAAEYVAGTLRGPARRRFETLLPGHPALRSAVTAWQRLLMPLTTAVTPEAPPPHVWQALQHRLWPRATAGASSAAAAPQPWWRRLALWRTASAVATVAAVSFGVLLAKPPSAQTPVLVVLQSTGAGAGAIGGTGGGAVVASFVASVAGDGGALVMQPLQPVALQAGRALELWSLPPSGAPLSLGVINAGGTTVLRRDRLPATLLKGGTAALAVTVEPPGGSPTGAPTGPVVYAGKLQI